jgi:hypothetical protein
MLIMHAARSSLAISGKNRRSMGIGPASIKALLTKKPSPFVQMPARIVCLQCVSIEVVSDAP